MSAALLPDELIQPKRRYLADLGKAETGYIRFTELIVMSDRSCFLNLEAELRRKSSSTVQVMRGEDGSFHVIVPFGITYEPGDLPPQANAKLEPVASIGISSPAIR